MGEDEAAKERQSDKDRVAAEQKRKADEAAKEKPK